MQSVLTRHRTKKKITKSPLMAAIYSRAKHVCIWLGEARVNTYRAMRLVTRIRNPHIFDRLVEQHSEVEDWVALMDLMQREWFSRRWIIQEVALAKAATLYYGEHRLDWDAFAETVTLCHILEDRVKDKFPHHLRLDSWRDVQWHNKVKLVRLRDDGLHSDEKPQQSTHLKIPLPKIRVTSSDDQDDGVHSDEKPQQSTHLEIPLPRIRVTISDDQDYRYRTNKFIPFRSFNASILIDLVDKVVIRDEKGTAVWKKMSFEELLSTLSLFDASCPQDVIYALASLAGDVCDTSVPQGIGDALRNDYPVDYDKPFIKVAEEFLEFVTNRSRSLDMILRPWVPHSVGYSLTLPSWIRTSKHAPLQKDEYGLYRRCNADLLVGMPGNTPYSASGPDSSRRIEWSFHHIDEVPVLTARGFIFEKIEALTVKAAEGFVPPSWFAFTGYTSDLPIPPQKFWETMVAARNAQGEKAPRWYVGLIKIAYEENFRVYHVETTQMRTSRTSSKLMDEYQERVSAVVWDRKLMRTDTTRKVGLVPDDSQVGDMICILYGCSVPVVLRSFKEGSRSGYRIIGECYVEGIMDGQATIERHRSGVVTDEVFDIY